MSTDVAVYEAPVPTEVVAYSTTVATELARVVKEQGLAKVIQGREYLTAEAWGAAGEMLDLSVKVDEPQPFTDSTGKRGYMCRAHLYRPDGRELSSATAICTRAERRWSGADDYAIFSMAQTRAIGKAYRSRLSFIAVLAGYEATPAEEMPVGVEVAEPVAAPRIVEPEQAAAPAPHQTTAAKVFASGIDAGGVVRFISKNQQKELAAAAKKAQLTWDGLKHWLASEHSVVVERQADLTESAFHLAVAFCNETSWTETLEQIGEETA